MEKIVFLAGLILIILVAGLFYLNNFGKEYAEGCGQIFTEKILFFEKSVWDCDNKSNFVLIKPINNFKQISDQETAILFAQNRFPQAKGCKPEVNEDECCYTVKLACSGYSVSQYFSKYFASPSATLFYLGADFTPTLRKSLFKDCGHSQIGNTIYAACGSYTIGFEIVNYRVNRTFVEVHNPDSAFQELFKIRRDLFAFLGYDTSNAAIGECVPRVSACGDECMLHECKVGDEFFVLRQKEGRSVLMTKWGSLG